MAPRSQSAPAAEPVFDEVCSEASGDEDAGVPPPHHHKPAQDPVFEAAETESSEGSVLILLALPGRDEGWGEEWWMLMALPGRDFS